MVELADTRDSKSRSRKAVRVRLPLWPESFFKKFGAREKFDRAIIFHKIYLFMRKPNPERSQGFAEESLNERKESVSNNIEEELKKLLKSIDDYEVGYQRAINRGDKKTAAKILEILERLKGRYQKILHQSKFKT